MSDCLEAELCTLLCFLRKTTSKTHEQMEVWTSGLVNGRAARGAAGEQADEYTREEVAEYLLSYTKYLQY